MYRIDETDFGYRVTLEGFLQRDAAAALLGETRRQVRPRPDGFGLLLDLRSSRAFPAESQELLKQMILLCRESGLARTAVLLNSAITALQIRRLARETGIDRWIRAIDVSSEPAFEQVASHWLDGAVEPNGFHRLDGAVEPNRFTRLDGAVEPAVEPDRDHRLDPRGRLPIDQHDQAAAPVRLDRLGPALEQAAG